MSRADSRTTAFNGQGFINGLRAQARRLVSN